MFSQRLIDYPTPHSDLSVEELLHLQKSAPSELVLIELVQRSLLGSGSNFPATEAVKICQEQRRKNPHHNYFDLALSMHTGDPAEREILLLSAADITHIAAVNKLAGLAAMQLVELYSGRQLYIKSQAWLIHAVNLGNEQALRFYGIGVYEQSLFKTIDSINSSIAAEAFTPAANKTSQSSMTALLLSSAVTLVMLQARLFPHCFMGHWTSIDDYRVIGNDERDILQQIHSTKNPIDALKLYHDSILGLVAATAAENDPFVFYRFFVYCAEKKIISLQIDKAIMGFLTNYPREFGILKISEESGWMKGSGISKINTSCGQALTQRLTNQFRMFYISSPDAVFFMDKSKEYITPLSCNRMAFDHQIQPQKEAIMASKKDLEKISLLTSHTIPIADENIKKLAMERLNIGINSENKEHRELEATVKPSVVQSVLVKHHIPDAFIRPNNTHTSDSNTTQSVTQCPYTLFQEGSPESAGNKPRVPQFPFI